MKLRRTVERATEETSAVMRPRGTRRRFVVLPLLLTVGALLIAHGRQQRTPPVLDDAARLVETGSAAHVFAPPDAPREFKIVSYNIRWRGGAELRALAKDLRADRELGGALVVGLQEVDRRRKRTQGENGARVLAEALGMNYAWAAPPAPVGEEEETGVMLLSPYPLSDVTRLLLPVAGPGGRRRVALGATVKLGGADVRVYCVHAETRIKVAQKIEQQRAVLDDLARYPKVTRAVVLGDFNTWEAQAADETEKLFKGAGFAPGIDNGRATFHRFILELKLDWLWLRGLEPLASGVAQHVAYSDHWPLWAVVRLKDEKKAAE